MDLFTLNTSFDFDGTLTRPQVQEYVKGLLDENIAVFIITCRYDNANLHKYENDKWRIQANKDLYQLAYDLDIPTERIIFTNMKSKSIFFKKNSNFLFHLDDDLLEILEMKNGQVPAINVNSRSWKNKCDSILNAVYESN